MTNQPEAITAAVSDRICKHMNKDHADAVLYYAQVYGNLPNAIAATMASIDSLGMQLTVQTSDAEQVIRIGFDHELTSAQDAHHTLVAMLRQSQPSASD